MSDIITRVKEFIRKYNLQDKTIVVGFSGGYDSMCLLDVLCKIKDSPSFSQMNLVAAHFNHNWRGEESYKEQEVCRLFSASRDVKFYTRVADSCVKKTENDARIARYEFFGEAVEYFDADAVFTAHNKDDNAETVLYRVIKGTGIYGLKGISQRRDCFYRPLLKTTRSEILEYCDKNNLAPNYDSSNSDTMYNRNYIRLNIIPAIEKINPSVKESINILSEIAQSEEAIIEEYMSTIRIKVFDEDTIITSVYKELSPFVKKRLVYDYVRDSGIDYDYKRINEVYDFIEENINKRNGSTISLSASSWLYVDDKIIEVIPHKDKRYSATYMNDREYSIVGEGEHDIGGKKLIIKKYDAKSFFVFPKSTENIAFVDLSKAEFPLTVRNRRDGDIINPFGMDGTMKLKKYLNSKGVSKHRRDELLIVADKEDILWVVGVGLSNKIRVSGLPTHILEVR